MPTPITQTTVTFTYNIADELFSSSNSNNRTATAIYTGPDRVWVHVDADTGDYKLEHQVLTTEHDGANTPVPFGTRKVEVVAADDPLIIALIYPTYTVTQDQTLVTENLPDGTTYSYNNLPTVDQTYNVDHLIHDGSAWTLPNFREPFVTWEELIKTRNNMLLASDGKIAPDQPAAVKQPWIDYRQALRDLPSTFGYGTENQVAAWKISLPTSPE